MNTTRFATSRPTVSTTTAILAALAIAAPNAAAQPAAHRVAVPPNVARRAIQLGAQDFAALLDSPRIHVGRCERRRRSTACRIRIRGRRQRATAVAVVWKRGDAYYVRLDALRVRARRG